MVGYQLSPEKKEIILNAIYGHLESRKPYLKQRYTMRNLAEDLNITYTYLSFIINRELGVSFNDLINRYRIDYMKGLLEQKGLGLYTLEGLAYASGFNSRSTFYRAFYKITGRMPSDFLRQIQKTKGA
jgi:AraC-like DNA-binding protein